MLIGYHIVKTAYGQWLPGDKRGHWSAVWDAQIGRLSESRLNPGDPALEELSRARMQRPPVTFSHEMKAAIRDALLTCESASRWSIVEHALEPTHLHLLVTHEADDIDKTCKWIAQQTTQAVHSATQHDGPVWAKGKWCEHIDDHQHWEALIEYLRRHPSNKAADAIRASSPPARADSIRGFEGDWPLTIISGGQTGADRAALDFAIAHGLPHGGWCPRGRLAEDGPLDPRYRLQETDSRKYDVRTRRNVAQSDATVVFSESEQPTGGTLLTLDYARRVGKPCLLLARSAEKPVAAHAAALRGLIAASGVKKLNVAGPRASQAPGIGAFVEEVLGAALSFETPMTKHQ